MKKLLLCTLLVVVAAALVYGYHVLQVKPIAAMAPIPAAEVNPLNVTVDKLEVIKSQRKLYAYSNGKLAKTYRICLGRSPVGKKEYKGDNKTPEGLYTINDKNPNSSCYKNLGISYPNDADRKAANKLGKSTGGDIKIHGIPNGWTDISPTQMLTDWTYGCIAVTNSDMEELYTYVPVGTPIWIKP